MLSSVSGEQLRTSSGGQWRDSLKVSVLFGCDVSTVEPKRLVSTDVLPGNQVTRERRRFTLVRDTPEAITQETQQQTSTDSGWRSRIDRSRSPSVFKSTTVDVGRTESRTLDSSGRRTILAAATTPVVGGFCQQAGRLAGWLIGPRLSPWVG